MHYSRILRIIFVLVIAVLAILIKNVKTQQAQDLWCCCSENGTALQPTPVMNTTNCTYPFNFTIYKLNVSDILLNKSCTQICSEIVNITVPLPPAPPPPAGCGSPGYAPKPNLTIKNVKGLPNLLLEFSLECPADSINLTRCKASNCTTFIFSGDRTSFVDENLEWNTNYTYYLSATYPIGGTSNTTTKIGNVGDIECWFQFGSDKFCISREYYYNFENYFKTKGYELEPGKSKSAKDFNQNFNASLDSLFNWWVRRYNKAFSCNEFNRLVLELECGANEVCTAKGETARCVNKETPCGQANPFGLFFAQQTCEFNGTEPKYCFFDRSKTIQDFCYRCRQDMVCYDYKTKEACERNPCGLGDCQWRYIEGGEDIGIGVCIDKRFNNCPFCDKKGSAAAPNKEAFNEVFDACTTQKARALSTEKFPCFYNPDGKKAFSCDLASCFELGLANCGVPAQGIKLGTNNELLAFSENLCGIKVCARNSVCFKDADGDATPDCPLGNLTCERDYLAPETSAFIVSNQQGITEWLHFKIYDKTNKTAPLRDKTRAPGYSTYICLEKNIACDARNQTQWRRINASLRVENLNLKIGNATIANLSEGKNLIKFWSEDPAKNREIVKNISIFACRACQGPALISVNITGGRFIENELWSWQRQPNITLSFSSPTNILAIKLTNATEEISLETTQTGFVQDWIFKPTKLLNGSYNLGFTAKNELGLFLNPNASEIPIPIKVNIIPDPTQVIFSPATGAVLNISNPTLIINTTNPVELQNLTLIEWQFSTPYLLKKFKIDLTENTSAVKNKTFSIALRNLFEGKHEIYFKALDFALRDVEASSWFVVATKAPKILLKAPSWGVSPTRIFNITVLTTAPAECKYLYDVPLPSPPATNETFKFAFKFNSTNATEHKIFNFARIPNGDLKEHNFVVYCKDSAGRISREELKLRVDPSPPKIISYFAQPNPITERALPDEDIFSTNFMVQLDEPGFCRYSATTNNFTAMENNFPFFDEVPKTALSAPVNVTQIANYSYWVACKNEAELIGSPVKINFWVDLNTTFRITPITPRYISNRTFVLGVDTNKRSWCYWGYDKDIIATPFSGNFTNAHRATITESNPGSYTYWISCLTAGGEESAAINYTVTIDETPPIMLFVNDSSDNINDPEVSYHRNKLRVAFLGKENESMVTQYVYKIDEKFGNKTLVNWTSSTMLNGTFWWVTGLNLTNDSTYIFTVKAINVVNLTSEPMESDGVTINFDALPEHCLNAIQDANETGIDCGGPCEPCPEGRACETNDDCESLKCEDGICKAPTCDDSILTPGFESDIDCGINCPACEIGKKCIQNSDCETNFCRSGLCDIPTACEDGRLTEESTETDVDCGGSCPKCNVGKSCLTDDDCKEGLTCKNGKCSSIADEDGDGVIDEIDECLETPPEEKDQVDEKGCSPSQKFSCDDAINDAWRIKYFNDVLCTGDGAPDADPDGDGLSNLDEFKQGTDPKKKDTDGDGWDDGIEILKGTDPKDPESHPTSALGKILIWLLVLILIGALGVGGYFAYQKLIKPRLKIKVPSKAPVPPPKIPLRIPPRIPAPPKIPVIEKLKKFAGPKPSPPEEYIPIESLKKVKKDEEPHKEAMEKIEKLRKGILKKEEEKELTKHLKEEHKEIFEKLKEAAHEKMLKKVKKEEEPHPEIFEKLKKLREGKGIEHKEILEHLAKEHKDVFEKLKKLKKK